MSSQEYLEAAYNLGYNGFWEGDSYPTVQLPDDEKSEWFRGWSDAHKEQLEQVNYCDYFTD